MCGVACHSHGLASSPSASSILRIMWYPVCIIYFNAPPGVPALSMCPLRRAARTVVCSSPTIPGYSSRVRFRCGRLAAFSSSCACPAAFLLFAAFYFLPRLIVVPRPSRGFVSVFHFVSVVRVL